MTRRTSTSLPRSSALLLTLASLGACTPPESQEPAPETLTALGQPIGPIVAPAPPAAPRLTDCPDGWTAEGEGASLRCRPDWTVEAPRLTDCPLGWEPTSVGMNDPREVCLPAAPTDCPAGERPDLASAQCVRVGTTCPTDSEWAPPPSDASQILYVRPGGTGDGSEAAPFGSIEAAVAAATPGAVVLLAVGEYTTATGVDLELTILGACAAETRIVGTAAPINDANVNEDFAGALHVHDLGKLTLENVTLSGERTTVTVRGGGHAALSDVLVDDFTPQGMWVADSGSTLSVSKSLFTGGRVAETRTVSPGVSAAFEGHAEIRDSAFVDCAGRAVGALSEGTATLTDVSITDIRAGTAGTSAPIYAIGKSHVEAERVHISGFYGQAVGVLGSTVELSWVSVEHGVSSGSNAQTVGLRSLEGSSMSCSSCVIRDVQGFGVTSPMEEDERGELTLRDVLIAEFELSADGSGAGISTDHSDVTLERVEVLDVPGTAVRIVNGNASLTDVRGVDAGILHDDRWGIGCFEGSFLLRRVAAEGMPLGVGNASYSVEEVLTTGWTEVLQDGRANYGLELTGEGQARRIHVGQSYGYGLYFGKGTHDVSEVVVEDLKPVVTSDANLGIGVVVSEGADVEGSHWVTRRISGVGVLGMGTLSLEDAVVADTLERRDGVYGVGIWLADDAVLSRIRVERSFGFGVVAAQTAVALTDLAIQETRAGRVGGLYGHGLWLASADVEGNRISIDDAQSAGVSADGSEVTLRDLAVTRIRPGTAFHDGGEGLWFAGSSNVTLERASVSDTFCAGVGASQGALVSATELQVQGVSPGRALLKDVFGIQLAEGVADCVILAEGAEGNFSRASLAACARSGLLLQRAAATLGDVEIKNVPVGVATQYAELPEHDPLQLHLEGVGSPELRNPGYGVPSGPPIGTDMRFDDLFLETER